MPWYEIVLIAILFSAIGYHTIWLTQLEMHIKVQRMEMDALLVKLTGRKDGATLSEAMEKGPSSVHALKEFLSEHPQRG